MVGKVLISGAFVVALGLVGGCGQGPVAVAVIFGGILSLLLGCGSITAAEAKFAKVVPIRFVPEPAVTPEPEPAPVAVVEEPASEPTIAEAPRVRPRVRVRRVQPAAMNSVLNPPEERVRYPAISRLGPSYWRDRPRIQVQEEKIP